MGAGAGQKERAKTPQINTVTGRLKITVTNASLFHQEGLFKMNPYVKLKISNQEFSTKVISKGNKNPKFNETFTFYINSRHKIYGRSLEVTVMDENMIGPESQIGFGVVDLDPLVNQKKEKEEIRCFINKKRQPAGVVNMIGYFLQQTPKTLSFNFQNALIRRRNCTFIHMHSWVDIEVTIGEDCVKTSRTKDKKSVLPSWENQVIRINCFPAIKECMITVYENDQKVGSLILNNQLLLDENSEQFFSEQFYDQHGTNTGNLKFKVLSGQNPQFSHLKVSQRKSKVVYNPEISLENIESNIMKGPQEIQKKGDQYNKGGLQEWQNRSTLSKNN